MVAEVATLRDVVSGSPNYGDRCMVAEVATLRSVVSGLPNSCESGYDLSGNLTDSPVRAD